MDHRPEVRLSDAERAAAVEHLFAAQRDGRITLDEFDARLAVAHAAHVVGDLAGVLGDLPSTRPVTGVQELDAGVGGLTRSGSWTVPRRLRVQQHVDAHGLVLIDLSAAALTYPQLDVELRLGMYGSARFVLPSGATADLSRLRAPGRVPRTDVPAEPGSGLHLVVVGVAPRRRSVRVVFAR